MRSGFIAFWASLLAVVCVAQAASTAPAPEIRIFHDKALDIIFAYPGEFTPVVTAAAKSQADGKGDAQPQCVRSILTAGTESKQGSSAFVLSGIDGACPAVLKQAEDVSSFTREQIMRQLKRYGTPTLVQEPYRYSIDGRPAAVTLASATPDANPETPVSPVTTYAAKACFLSEIPEARVKGKTAKPSGEVLCFDFTTQQRDLMTRILSFTIKFGDDVPHPVVPGVAVR
jgi:hypothetical protein